MTVKQLVSKMTPGFIKSKVRSIRQSEDLEKLNSLEKLDCVTINLHSINGFSLAEIFKSDEINSFWNSSKEQIASFNIPDGTGGVNPGDRRAIFYLIGKLKPTSVLEIGTHIGASTIHIASALYFSQIKNNGNATITTLDIRDVNSAIEKPWLKYGTEFSPIEMINKLNYASFVNFVKDKSLAFLKNTNEKFDFIFLDGDHAATTVYNEIPAALKLLKPNGIILLHDYFPNLKPLWSNGSVLQGPYMATERLITENANLIVLPLGELPWLTKLNSNITSLALLMRKN